MDYAAKSSPATKRQRTSTASFVAEKAAECLKAITKSKQNYHPQENKNLLLRMFIEFAQDGYNECSYEKSECLKDWISESKIDVNQKDWIKKYESQVQDMNWNSRNMKPVLLAYILKDLLPILLKCNDDVTYTDEDGKTILHLFLETFVNNMRFYSQDVEQKIPIVAKKLIEMGASVNVVDKQGITPFHITVRKYHHRELLDTMLKHFTNVHSCDEDGNTILHYAMEKFIDGDRVPVTRLNDVVCIFLIKGADMHRKNKDGITPLHIAAKYGNVYVLKIFLHCGADVNMRTNDGETLLLMACKNLRIHDHDGIRGGTIELLLKKGCDINATDKDGYSPLHFLVGYVEEFVKMLVERGANVRCRTKEFGLTPLHLARCKKMMKILIEAGAEVDAKTVDGVTPLLMAAMNCSDTKDLEYLMEQGADVKVRDELFGFTSLHMSVLCSGEKKFEFLLGQGLDVNDSGKYGVTPLHLAALAGNHKIVQVMIERGADVNCRDEITRSTPLDFASQKADGNAVDDVINRTASGKGGNPIRKSWKVSKLWMQNHDKVIGLLVESGARMTLRDAGGNPASHG